MPKFKQPSSEPPSYGVLVLFRNDVSTATPLLRELRQTMDRLEKGYQVLLLDDGSTDGTAAILAAETRRWPQAQPYCFTSRVGKSSAFYYGLRKLTAEIIVLIEGDGQNDPADIGPMIRNLDGYDMVLGRREAPSPDSAAPDLTGLVRVLAGQSISGKECRMKAFRKSVTDVLLPLPTLYLYMPVFALAANYKLTEMAVRHRPHAKKSSRVERESGFFGSLLDMIGIWWFVARRFKTPDLAPPKA